MFSSIGLYGQDSLEHLTFKSNDDRWQMLDSYANQLTFADSLAAIKEVLEIKKSYREMAASRLVLIPLV